MVEHHEDKKPNLSHGLLSYTVMSVIFRIRKQTLMDIY